MPAESEKEETESERIGLEVSLYLRLKTLDLRIPRNLGCMAFGDREIGEERGDRRALLDQNRLITHQRRPSLRAKPFRMC
jgi:hypothetical protein